MPFADSFNIVLVEPEIPQNTGSIARLCGATNSILHLVKPLGFSTDDKYLKRAGLDYWQFVSIKYWESFEQFLDSVDETKLHLFTTKVKRPYTACTFNPGDFLLFGKESKGLPAGILEWFAPQCATVPMENPNIRSLNLAMSVAVVLYEAIRSSQTNPAP